MTPACRSAPAPAELRAGIRAVGSLDPLAVSASERTGSENLVLRQLFEGLVRYDQRTLVPRPALATSWTTSKDARTFTFALRRGARFHNGREVTADDVVYSLSRLARAGCGPSTSATTGAPASLLSVVIGYADTATSCAAPTLAGVTAQGRRIVRIGLSEPWADFVSVLGNPAASIVPRESVEAGEDAFAARPVGTGPYRLTSPWDGRALRLQRFDRYWGPKASIPSIAFVGYPDDTTPYLDLVQGRIHYAPVPPSRAAQARRRFGGEGFVRGVGLYFFGFNLRSARVQPPDFRVGLSRAVDRRSLGAAIFKGVRDPASGLVPPSVPGSAGSACRRACDFDLGAARRAIARAYPQGAPEILIGVSTQGSNPPVAAALAQMFAAAGVTARVVERPFREHLDGIAAGDVDVFQLGWIPEYPTADGLLWPLFRSSAQANYTKFKDAQVDELLQRARSAPDRVERQRLQAAAERRIVTGLPVLPLLWYRTAVAFDPRLEPVAGAVAVDGLGMTDFARMRFS